MVCETLRLRWLISDNWWRTRGAASFAARFAARLTACGFLEVLDGFHVKSRRHIRAVISSRTVSDATIVRRGLVETHNGVANQHH